jgi:hypothetical protein
VIGQNSPTDPLQGYLAEMAYMRRRLAELERAAGNSAWVSTFAPLIKQNGASVAYTAPASRWRYEGPMVNWFFDATMSANSTGAGPVSIQLPVVMPAPLGGTPDCGATGQWFDASTGSRYPFIGERDGFTSGAYMGYYQSGGIQLAIGDVWRFGVRYYWR